MEKQKSNALKHFRDYNSIVILLFLVLITLFAVDGMRTSFDRVIQEASFYGLFAVGLAVVMITGNIDLSVGFQAASAAIVTVLATNATNGNYFLVFLCVIAAGIIMGCINGFAVIRLGITPLIATIATNYIFKGFVYYFTRSGAIRPDGDLRPALQKLLAKNCILGSKALCVTVLLLVAVLVVLYFVMRYTRFGVGIYITGDNAEAGRLAGINTKRTTFLAYIICSVCCSLAGMILASKAGSAIYTQGEGREVFAISACVIGGIKMAGGKGTMLNVLIGVLIMRVISTGMDMMLIPAAWVDFVSGVLLLVILIIDKATSVKKND